MSVTVIRREISRARDTLLVFFSTKDFFRVARYSTIGLVAIYRVYRDYPLKYVSFRA